MELIIIFIIAWALSPIVLIPMTIIFYRKKKKLSSFAEKLLRAGRISGEEFSRLDINEPASSPVSAPVHVPEIKPAPAENSQTPTASSVHIIPEQDKKADAPVSPTSRTIPAAEVPVNAVPRPADIPQNRGNAPVGQGAGAMSVLMMIGIIFVILAGIVFSTAVWVNLGNIGRACAVGMVSALFFGISAFAKKKLRLESTSFAFYVLGTFFTAITLITAGAFGVFGEYFSVMGGGSSLLFASASLIISLLSAKGKSIFEKPAAAYISALSGMFAAILVFVQISPEASVFAVFMAILSLVVNTILFTFDIKISHSWRKPVMAAAALLNAVGVVSGIAAAFTDGVAVTAYSVIYILQTALIAVLGAKGHPVYKKRSAAAISLFTAFIFSLVLIWELSAGLVLFSLVLTAAAIAVMTAFVSAGVKFPEEWEYPSKLFAFSLYTLGIISSFAALCGSIGRWTALSFVIAGMHIVYSFVIGIMAVYGHNVYKKTSSAFAFLFTGMAFSVMLIIELFSGSNIMALCFTVLFLVFVNAVYSASPKLPSGWCMPINITAAILGIIGTVSSLIVLGESLSEWDITCYIIAALYIIQSIAVTVMAFMGHKVYGKGVFGVLSQLAGLSYAAMLLKNLTNTDTEFALALAFLAMLFTAASYFSAKISPEKWTPVTEAFRVILNLTAGVASAAVLIDRSGEWDILCVILALSYIAYTSVWGICRKNSFIKAAECLISCFAVINAYPLAEKISSDNALLIILSGFFALALVHHYVKPIRTVLSDVFLPAVLVICTFSENNILSPISFIILGVYFIIRALEKNNAMSVLFRVLLPLPASGIVYTAVNLLSDRFFPGYAELDCLIAAVTAVVLALVAAVLRLLKKHSGAAFYSFCITSAITVFAACETSSIYILAAVIAVSIVITVLLYMSPNNIPSIISISGLTACLCSMLSIAEPEGDWVYCIFAAALVFISLAFSRVLFSEKLVSKENETIKVDTCCTGILLSLFMLSGVSEKTAVFAVLTGFAVFFGNLARKKHSDDFNRAMLTAGCGLFILALIFRPFLVVEDALFSRKITLGLICLFGYIFSKLWKKYSGLSDGVSTAIYGISFVILIIEALIYQNIVNTFIVLLVSLAILLYSFVTKKKRWFAVSSISLTGLTLYIFRDLFLMIDWWIYLLVVGMILIAVSSANEYFIKKGRELKEKAGRFFEDWKW